MYRYFVLLCALGLSNQCCFPPEWEAHENIIVATKGSGKITPTIMKSTMRISWDSPMRRYAVTGVSSTNGVVNNFKSLSDYISNVMYQVVGNQCNVTALTEPFNSVTCTPADAKISSPVNLGLGQLQITQYNYVQNNQTVYSNVAEGCIPVSFTTYGKLLNNDRRYVSGSFSDLTVGIKDRSVFNIPQECRGVSVNTLG